MRRLRQQKQDDMMNETQVRSAQLLWLVAEDGNNAEDKEDSNLQQQQQP